MRKTWFVASLCFVLLLLFSWFGNSLSLQSNEPAWAQPSSKIVQRIGAPSDVPEQPNYQSNLDCTTITYRISGSGQMRTGCFMSTAFGFFDADNQTVILNGTDEAVALKSYGSGEVITPWQASGTALALEIISTGGAALHLYGAVYESLQTNYALGGYIANKQFIHPPDQAIRLPDGRVAVVNPQTIAFSANGAWLVAETLQGEFIRVNLATLDVVPFAQSYAASGNPALYKSNVAISGNGRFVAIENAVNNSFTVFDLKGCSVTMTAIATTTCAKYDYKPFIANSLGVISEIKHVRFVTEQMLIFDGTVTNERNRYAMAPQSALPKRSSYLALGDSYTSGEGAFDYTYGTDTDKNHCHLSNWSYPKRIIREVYAGGGQVVACSGAVIGDIHPRNSQAYRGQIVGGTPKSQHSESYDEQILSDFTPGVLAQNAFVSVLQPNILSVSIGGNDIGFGDILTECVMPHVSIKPTGNDCYATLEDRQEVLQRIDKTIPKWVSAFADAKHRSPLSRIYVIGYPSIVAQNGTCGRNVHLSNTEIAFANQLVTYLNGAIASAAKQSNNTYVAIEHALEGHRLCETDARSIAVNGLTAGKDSGVKSLRFLGRESYHPNQFGHELIAAAILAATHNFTELTQPQNTPTSSAILSVPATGRLVRPTQTLQLEQTVVQQGASIHITVSGTEYGLPANAPYTMRINTGSSEIRNAGTTLVNGNLDVIVQIPSTSYSGGTKLEILVTQGPGMPPITLQTPLYISNSIDADADGISDQTDSCPYANNSGVDEDSDGIDDTCDGTYTIPGVPVTTAQNSTKLVAALVKTPPPTTNTVAYPKSPLLSTSCTNCSSVLGAQSRSTSRLAVYKNVPRILPIVWFVLPIVSIVVLLVLGFMIGRGLRNIKNHVRLW